MPKLLLDQDQIKKKDEENEFSLSKYEQWFLEAKDHLSLRDESLFIDDEWCGFRIFL